VINIFHEKQDAPLKRILIGGFNEKNDDVDQMW